MTSITDPVGRRVAFTYSPVGELTSIKDPVGNLSSFGYTTVSGSTVLETMTDPRGGVTKNEYDSFRRVVKQWDPFQMTQGSPIPSVFSYDIPGRQTTVTYPEGNQETLGFDGGLPVEITKAPGQPEEGVWQIAYSPVTAGPETVTDPNGNVTTMEWSVDGRMISKANGVDPSTEWTYDSDTGLPLTMTDPSGVTTTYTYDNDVNLASVSTPLNASTDRVVTYVHGDSAHPGDVTSVIDPNGEEWVFDYDSYGNVVSAADPLGNESTTAYDLLGRPVASVAPKGVAGTPADYRSTVAYDLNGRTLGSFGPTSAAVTDSFGQAPTTAGLGTADTGQSWAATAGVWGSNGGAYPVSGTNPITAVTTSSGNGAFAFTMPVAQAGMGVVFRMSDASHYWKFTANPGSNTWTLAKVGGTAVAPVTTATGTCCDRNAVVGIYLDGASVSASVNGSPVAWVADPDFTANTKVGLIAPAAGPGRIGSISFDTGGSRSFQGWDANGNPTWSVDGNNHITSTTYDASNRPVTEHRGDTTTITNTFDANNRLTGYTDAAANTTSYAYDEQDRIDTETPSGMAATNYAYAYSPGGGPGGETMTVTQPGGGTTTMTMDGAGRPSGLNYSDATADVTYGYDDNGRRTTMTTGGTSTSTWTFDDLGRMTTSTRAGRTVSYGYDLAGNTTSLDYPGSVTATRGFDAAGRLTSVTDWISAVTSFDYDANSNLTSSTYPNGVVTTRTYDRLDRPINITVKKGTSTRGAWAQTYDNNSQVTGVTATGVGSNQTYGYNTLNQLTNNGSNTLTYDTADNLTQLTATNRQKFNAANQLCWQTSAWTPTSDYTNPCTTTPGWSNNYTFDARGNRTTTTFPFAATKTHGYDLANRLTSYTQGTSTTASYKYDGDGLRLSKTVGRSTIVFTWAEDSGLPLLVAEGASNYLYGPLGEPIARVGTSGGRTNIHQDHIGSTRLLTDLNGNTSGTYTYTPYGATQTHTGNDITLQYAGQYTDPETGYQYLRARYYDPYSGLFLSVDPFVPATRSSYGYAGNDPVDRSDPGGLSPDCSWCILTPPPPVVEPPIDTTNETLWCGWPARYGACLRAYSISQDAIRAADEAYPPPVSGQPDQHESDRNALRHLLGASRLTWDLGCKTARGFLDRHERTVFGSVEDGRRDERNNNLAMSITVSLRAAGVTDYAQIESLLRSIVASGGGFR